VLYFVSFLGFIGKIQLQVPIRRLKSEHWIITLDKLVLVAGPLTDTEVMVLFCYTAFSCSPIKMYRFFGTHSYTINVYFWIVCVL